MSHQAIHSRVEGRGSRLSEYWPLAALLGVSALAAGAIVAGFGGGVRTFMHAYMGLFLSVFALLKLFDLEGFRHGGTSIPSSNSHLAWPISPSSCPR